MKQLKTIQENLSIVKLDPKDPPPQWALESSFYSLTRTREELSIVCESEKVPEAVQNRNDGWVGFNVQGPLGFSLTGILSSIATPLANARISIFAISSFAKCDVDEVIFYVNDKNYPADRIRERCQNEVNVRDCSLSKVIRLVKDGYTEEEIYERCIRE